MPWEESDRMTASIAGREVNTTGLHQQHQCDWQHQVCLSFSKLQKNDPARGPKQTEEYRDHPEEEVPEKM